MDRGLLTGLAVFRWVTWVWAAVVVVISRDQLDAPGNRPAAALALVGLAFAFTVAATVLVRTDPGRLLTPVPVVVEVSIGASLILGNHLAFSPDRQSLGSDWALTGLLSAGLAFGPWGGFAAGAALGAARLVGEVTGGTGPWVGPQILAVTSTVFLYTLGGAAAGFAASRARMIEREVGDARAREDVARHLHDGVLQTLAVVQRRTEDAELGRLAREQERELRAFLAGDLQDHGPDLGAALRRAAARFEDNHGGRVQVLVADDLPLIDETRCGAVAGAVGEALTNAGKHGGARHVTVYVEPTDEGGLFCSVNDDGGGFDPATTPEGLGLPRSIRGRIGEIGGRVEVESSPGRGTEIRMWVP
jgi:signal transduction histidine kinase